TYDWEAADRLSQEKDYFRCRNFAGGDLGALVDAMGDDRPGAVIEYASVWFERATKAGYPPALAELALRSGAHSREERLGLLQQATATGDSAVYWLLFAQMSGGDASRGTVEGLAWLIAACRAGTDCREQARWSRVWLCGQATTADCERGESALAYYWQARSPPERLAAYELAAAIEADARSGRFERIPMPQFADAINVPGQVADLRGDGS
ncbi:MAG: hypothetical protein ACRESW_06660, partial [Nevskiales bacterium]